MHARSSARGSSGHGLRHCCARKQSTLGSRTLTLRRLRSGPDLAPASAAAAPAPEVLQDGDYDEATYAEVVLALQAKRDEWHVEDDELSLHFYTMLAGGAWTKPFKWGRCGLRPLQVPRTHPRLLLAVPVAEDEGLSLQRARRRGQQHPGQGVVPEIASLLIGMVGGRKRQCLRQRARVGLRGQRGVHRLGGDAGPWQQHVGAHR